MRLLITTDTIGGVWTFTSELASEFLDHGHHVALVCFGGMPSESQGRRLASLTTRFAGFRSSICDAPLEWMPDNAAAYRAGKDLLLELCDSFQPDAMLLSQFCFGALPTSIPKIVIAHSDVLSWADAVGKTPLPAEAWLSNYRSLVQRGLDRADAVTAPTHAMLHGLRAHFTVPLHAEVIPNGRTITEPEKLPRRRLQAVTAGRMWDEAKNLRMLTDAAGPMPIVVAGNNDGIEVDSIELLGNMGEADVLNLFRESAIYICSSVYEPFGIAPLEAALCGCAVVANDIASLREVWGDAALYVHDAASLRCMLTRLCESPEELAAAQTLSRQRALTYTSAHMAEGYLRVIASIIADNSRSRAHAA